MSDEQRVAQQLKKLPCLGFAEIIGQGLIKEVTSDFREVPI